MDVGPILQKRERIKIWLTNFAQFIAQRVRTNKLTYVAAALSFTTLLSLVPLLSLSFTVLKSFPAFMALENSIKTFIFDNLVPTSSEVLQHNLDQFINQTGQLSLVGCFFLLVTALMTMATIERAFNQIWQVKRSRSGVSAFMLYWALLTMTPLLLGVSLFASSYLLSLSIITETASTLGFQNNLIAISSLVLEISAFSLLYIIVPHCKVSVKNAVIGGMIVGVAFESTKYLFALYISNFNTYEVLYGALATLPVFLIWIYITWLLILLGAELVNALDFSHSEKGGSADNFSITLAWLKVLRQAQKKGEGVRVHELIKSCGISHISNPNRIITALADIKIICQLNGGEYILAKSLKEITLYELYLQLPWKLPVKSKNQHIIRSNNEIEKIMSLSLDEFLG